MSVPLEEPSEDAVFAVITSGDTSRLSKEQKTQYYKARCDAAGLDARTAPFQFIKLQGREMLYALKGATELRLLRRKYGNLEELAKVFAAAAEVESHQPVDVSEGPRATV